MGAYISLFFDEVPIRMIAIGLAVLFGLLNLLGTKATTRFQNLLVISLLILLAWSFCSLAHFTRVIILPARSF